MQELGMLNKDYSLEEDEEAPQCIKSLFRD